MAELGGARSEGVDVVSSSFPLVKNQGLVEPIGLGNQQRGARQQYLAIHRRRTWTCTHSTNYFAPNVRKVVNLPGLLKTKRLNV